MNSSYYLGARITKHGGTEDDIKNRLGKATGAFNKLAKIWRSGQLSKNTKIRIFKSTMGDKSVETLGNKIDTSGPPIQCCVGAVVCAVEEIEKSTLFWGEGGKCDQDAQKFRELMLEANKIEQMLKYRKASFPRSVSTTFVAHCSVISSASLWMRNLENDKEG